MYRATCNGEEFFRTDVESNSLLVTDFDVNIVSGHTGDCTFTIPPANIIYGHELKKYGTRIRVYKDDKLLFSGRVNLDPEIDFNNMKTVSCEGIKGILNDVYIRPYKYTGDLHGYLRKFVDEYNAEGDIKITIRNITVDNETGLEFDEMQYYRAIEKIDDLAEKYGGYIDVVEEINGKVYLDWLKEYTEVNEQSVELGKNLMDLVGADATERTYTRLIPLGASQADSDGLSNGTRLTIASVNNGLDYLEVSSDLTITEIEVFDDVTDATELKAKGLKKMTEDLTPQASYTITSIDLANYGIDIGTFEARKLVNVNSPMNWIANMQVPVLQLSLRLIEPSANKLVLSNGIKAYSATEGRRLDRAARDAVLANEAGLSSSIRNKLGRMIRVEGTTLIIETEVNE